MLSSLNGKQDFQCDCPDPSTIPTGYARHSVFSELKRKTSNKATTDLLVMHCALFTMFFRGILAVVQKQRWLAVCRLVPCEGCVRCGSL